MWLPSSTSDPSSQTSIEIAEMSTRSTKSRKRKQEEIETNSDTTPEIVVTPTEKETTKEVSYFLVKAEPETRMEKGLQHPS